MMSVETAMVDQSQVSNDCKNNSQPWQPVGKPGDPGLSDTNAEHVDGNVPLHLSATLSPPSLARLLLPATIERSRVAASSPLAADRPVNERVVDERLEQRQQSLTTTTQRPHHVLTRQPEQALQSVSRITSLHVFTKDGHHYLSTNLFSGVIPGSAGFLKNTSGAN